MEKCRAEQKDENMQRFKIGDTQIMVGTTVIEVGIDIPNASVMVIESAEKFGLIPIASIERKCWQRKR